MITLSLNQISFKSYLPLKPYEKKNFLQTQTIPEEGDIIEKALISNPDITDKSNIYTSIGKIFEDAGLFYQAKMCFEKNANNLSAQNAQSSKILDNDSDLIRVHNKIQSSLDIKG